MERKTFRHLHRSFMGIMTRWMHFYSILFAGLWIFIAFSCIAQQSDSQIWYTYNHQAILSKKWGYTFDLNHRTGMVNNMQARISAARFGGIFFLDRNHRISGGYAWFGGYLKNAPVQMLDENRLWQQYLTLHKKGNLQYFNRFRLEQRWREQLPAIGSKRGKDFFQVRARYMFQIQGPVYRSATPREFMLWWQTASELMLQAGKGIDKHYFDQLRLIGGFVIQFNKSLSLATLYQYINQYRVQQHINQNIHTVRFTLLHTLDFTRHNNDWGPVPSQE